MTEKFGNFTRLGVYQRAVGKILAENIPVGVQASMKAMPSQPCSAWSIAGSPSITA